MHDHDETFEHDENEEPLAKDLLRRREHPARRYVAQDLAERLDLRSVRRPAGSSSRTWLRVAGEDPFLVIGEEELTRKTTYVDGRFVRIDQDEKEAARRAQGPSRPTSPASWDKPSTSSNAGESLIPPGFRSLPSSGKSKENVGESLIPPGFRDVPISKPKPPPPKARPASTQAPTATPPPNAKTTSSSGRMLVGRRREPLNAPPAPPHPTAAPAAPQPGAAPKGPPRAPTAPPPPADPPPRRTATELLERLRAAQIAAQAAKAAPPSGPPAIGVPTAPMTSNAVTPRSGSPAPPATSTPSAPPKPQAPAAPLTANAAPPRPPATAEQPPSPATAAPPQPAAAPAAPPAPLVSNAAPPMAPRAAPPEAPSPLPAGDETGPPVLTAANRGTLDDLFSSPLEGRARMSRRAAAPTTVRVEKADKPEPG
jgi:hypothetical protein